MTDYSAATINSGNSLASRLVVAAGAGRLQNIVDSAALSTVGTVTATTDGWTFGSGAAVVLPDTSLAEFTVFVWYFGSSTNGALVGRAAGGANEYRQNYVLELATGSTPKGGFKQDIPLNSYVSVTSSSSGTNGVLATSAYSFDGTTQEIYLNGTSTGTAAGVEPWQSISTGLITQIGNVNGADRDFRYQGNGIQLVLIFNAALTDAEIASLHANPDQVFNLAGGVPPAGTVTIGTIVPGSTSAVIPYTYSAGDATGFEYRLDGGTPAAIGASPATITGLTASTLYDIEVRAINANGNGAWSAVESFTTTTPDTTAPTVTSVGAVVKSNALAVISATTNEANGTMRVVTTTSATAPSKAQVKAGQDHTGAVAVFAGSQAIGSTGVKTFNATGHTALQTYYGYVVHTDAAGNDSDVEPTGAFVMFDEGATGQAIIDDTSAIPGVQEDGILVNDVELPADADKWFTYDVVTPVVDTASLTLFPNGSFIWTGTSADSFTYQLKVDGVDVGTPQLVTLYPEGEGPPPDPTPSNATKRTPNGMIGFWNR